jgi:hypothetical protein
VRIFLSFNSRDTVLAEAMRAGLSRIDPTAQVFFSPVSLGADFWLPKIAEEIAEAQSRANRERRGAIRAPLCNVPWYTYAQSAVGD